MPTTKRSSIYISVLAGIAAVVLAAGTALKPKHTPDPVVSEAERARLQKLAQRRDLQRVAEHFADLAQSWSNQIAYIEGMESSGVGWQQPNSVLIPGRSEVPATIQARVRPDGPATSLSITDSTAPLWIATSSSSALVHPSTLSTRPLRPGEWLLAIARNANGEMMFARGIYSGAEEIPCGDQRLTIISMESPFTRAFLGGGLFDIDGQLVGVIIQCGSRYTAVPVEGIMHLLTESKSLESRLISRVGLRIATAQEPPSEGDADGLFVAEVWKDRGAGRAGLRAGDRLLSINNAPVASMADLEPLLKDEGSTVVILRAGKKLKLDFGKQDEADLPSPLLAGLRLRNLTDAAVIDTVQPGSAAYQAGLRAGDRIVSVGNKQTSTPAALKRAVQTLTEIPALVVVDRDRREMALWVR